MQIYLITPTGSLFTLQDDAAAMPFHLGNNAAGIGGLIIGDDPWKRQTRNVQLSDIIRSGYKFGAARLNAVNYATFQVLRWFATNQLCSDFIFTHADYVPLAGELYIVDNTQGGRAAYYYKTALPQNIHRVDRVGASCVYEYEIALPCSFQLTP